MCHVQACRFIPSVGKSCVSAFHGSESRLRSRRIVLCGPENAYDVGKYNTLIGKEEYTHAPNRRVP